MGSSHAHRERPSAYQAAVRRIARRDHSEHEIREALLRAGYPENEVEAALARLRESRLVDDRGFAERFARSRLKNSGLGRHLIRHALKRRGVARATAETGLREALEEIPEDEVLERRARAYWRSHPRDAPDVRLRKLWAFLVRRGFPVGRVAERLRTLWPQWSEAVAELEGLEAEDPRGVDSEGEPRRP